MRCFLLFISGIRLLLIFGRDSDGTSVALSIIVGRHDLDAGFVKRILYVLMQVRIDLRKLVGFLYICIYLVTGVVILQLRFQNEGFRV